MSPTRFTFSHACLAALVAAASLLPPVAHAAPNAFQRVPSAAGRVFDAATGTPLAGALVQQRGAVTSTFTAPDGRFRLVLDQEGEAIVVISAVGYDSLELGASKSGTEDMVVRLTPVAGFLPIGPTMPTAGTMSLAETAPLNTGLQFAYRVRQSNQKAYDAAIGGLINNDYRLGARFRWRPFLVEGEGSHHGMPVDVTGLARESNPAFSPSTWALGGRLGLFTPVFHPDLEAAVLGAYRWNNNVPNNQNVPYTGSFLDFEQTRHAFGGVALMAWRPGRGRFHLEGSYGLYPSVLWGVKTPGTDSPVGTGAFSDLRLVLGYEMLPGLRLGLALNQETWTGGDPYKGGTAFLDDARMLGLQLHYTPGGVPKGNEP